MKATIKFVRFDLIVDDGSLTAQFIECYREVFADGPWHEWMKCPVCQKYWGKKDAGLLAQMKFRHCDNPLVDFWPRDQVMIDLEHELDPEASCWLALDDSQVVGFCFGYPIQAEKLEAKLGVSLGRVDVVAYQDDVGVLASYRDQKIAKAMVARRLDDFLNQGLEFGVVRTRQTPEPSVTFNWYTEKLGYEVIARYPEGDGRVILGRKLQGLRELFNH
jgi:GNAT superfamily N-acetyltransferase